MYGFHQICFSSFVALLTAQVLVVSSTIANAQPRALSFAVSGNDLASQFEVRKTDYATFAVKRCSQKSMAPGIFYKEYVREIDWADANTARSETERVRGEAVHDTGCEMRVGRSGNELWIVIGKPGELDACQKTGANCFAMAQSWAKYQPQMFTDDTAQRPIEFGTRKLLIDAALKAEQIARTQRETAEKAKQSADNERNAIENAKRVKTQTFVDKHRAVAWLNSDKASKNPFLFEGKTLIVKTKLETFASRDTAYFTRFGGNPPFICTGISGESYAETGWVMMAVKVLGTGTFEFLGSKVPVPRVRYVDHVKCNVDTCNEFADTFNVKQ